jgi:hypothetical protein
MESYLISLSHFNQTEEAYLASHFGQSKMPLSMLVERLSAISSALAYMPKWSSLE